MDVETLKSLMDYDAETGALTWKVRPREHFKTTNAHRSWNTRYPGKFVGSTQPEGYRYVRVFGVRYMCHRLIWLLVHGKWPEHQIDHKNGDPGDNRISNLRDATSRQNGSNITSPKNTSGAIGVSWNKKQRKWVAHIRVNRVQHYLGLFESFDDAVAARRAAEAVYQGEFSLNMSRGRSK